MMRLVPTWHRAYVRSHRWGLFMSIGFLVTGVVGVCLPWLVEDSAPALTLPDWLLTCFYATWALGGFLASFGLLRGRRDLEVPGLCLIAGGLSAYFSTVIAIRAVSAVGAAFLIFVALGAAARAWELATHGYDGQQR